MTTEQQQKMLTTQRLILSRKRLKKMETSFSKEKNYTLAKEAIIELKWRLQVDNKGFLEAFNPDHQHLQYRPEPEPGGLILRQESPEYPPVSQNVYDTGARG